MSAQIMAASGWQFAGHPGHSATACRVMCCDFAKADEEWLDDVLCGVSDGAPHLAAGDGASS
jgi:PTH1 family peptidyl-tRNA hydrolase